MKVIGTLEVYGEAVQVVEAAYRGGAVAYALEGADGSPFGHLSVNVPGTELAPGEFLAKTWSENEPLRAPVLASGLFIDTRKRINLGHVEAEIWKRTEVH